MKQALLIIDVQNDYFAHGKMTLHQPEAALERINRLEEKFLAENQLIIYIQHIKYDEKADFFGLGTQGAELHPKLKIDKNSIIIEKHFPNSFLETNLLEILQADHIGQVVITGMMTHMCVDSTTRAACELGFQPILISDATATKDLKLGDKKVSAEEVQVSFLSALKTFAKLIGTVEFLKYENDDKFQSMIQ